MGEIVEDGDLWLARQSCRLIDEYPLAWVCADDGRENCQLPLLRQCNDNGDLVEIIGHFALANPLAQILPHKPRARFLFTGPQGYISPRVVGRHDWGPTWNYAQLMVEGDVEVSADFTDEAVALLTEHLEKQRDNAWSIAELGARYDLLKQQIIGFRAKVTQVTPRFKLGQGEKLADLRAMIANMEAGDLRDWMIRFNHVRLAEDKAGT